MITNRSRYANSVVSLTDGTRGSVVTLMPRQPETRVFNFTYLAVEEGDRIDLMANRLYGDDSQWWRIADANPEIMDWSRLPVGTVLRIPSA